MISPPCCWLPNQVRAPLICQHPEVIYHNASKADFGCSEPALSKLSTGGSKPRAARHNSPAHPFYFLFASAGCVKGRAGLIEESSSGTWSSRVRLHPPPPLELQTLPAPAQLHSSVGSMDSDEVPSTRRTKSLLSPLCFESKDTKTAQPPPFTLPLTPFVAFVIAPSQLSTRVVEDGWTRLGSSRLGGHRAAGVLDLLPPSWKQRRSDDSLSVAACYLTDRLRPRLQRP